MEEVLYQRLGLDGLKRCAEQRQTDPAAWFYLGLAQLDAQDGLGAHIALSRAIELDPTGEQRPREAKLYLGHALRMMKHPALAAAAYAEVAKASGPGGSRIEACCCGGEQYELAGDLPAAVELFKLALQANPEEPRGTLGLIRLSLTDVQMERPANFRRPKLDGVVSFGDSGPNQGACRMRSFQAYDNGPDVVIISADEDRTGEPGSFHVELAVGSFREHFGAWGSLRFVVFYTTMGPSIALVEMGPEESDTASFQHLRFDTLEELTGFRLLWE